MTSRTLYPAAGLLLLLALPRFAAAQAEKPNDVSGAWELTSETPAGKFTSTVRIQRQGDALTAVSVGKDSKETPLHHVMLSGSTLTFDEDTSYEGTDYHLVYTGKVEGDQIHGTFETMGQTMDWSARRLAAAGTPPAGAAPASAAGTWKITVETPNGSREQTLTLKQEGEKLTGTIASPTGQTINVDELALKGSELRFTISFDRNGTPVKRTFIGTLSGDTITGTVEGGTQSRSFTGRRQPSDTAAASPAGRWKLAVESPSQTYHPTVVLTQQDGKWSGQFLVEQGGMEPLKDLVVNGNQVSFTTDIHFNDMDIHLKFIGTIDADKLKGSFDANGSALPTTGEREAKS